MSFYADLHIHSKYSRATSRDCDLEHLSWWAQRKGIAVVATGDFTHPAWWEELRTKLIPAEPGLYRLRPEIEREVARTLPGICRRPTRFLLEVEVSTIYKRGDKTRKIHHLIYAGHMETAARFRDKLGSIGNIASDGRPILGLDSRHLLEITLESGPDAYLIPAHIWTPWFAVLGSKGGFDHIAECYGELSNHIFAVETGLSSDPPMNWRVSQLDRYTLVSNSDAHSPPKLGREACVFDTDMDYFAMRQALETGHSFGGTVEFFPEEGKYHLDGHRACNIRLEPEETRARDGLCPVCSKPLTVGVMHRVEELADRPEPEPSSRLPFRSLVPLPEVMSELRAVGPRSKTVTQAVARLVDRLGPELEILESLPLEDVARAGDSLVVEALSRLRSGKVHCESGYDGEYGIIRMFEPGELDRRTAVASLFESPPRPEPAKPKVAKCPPPTKKGESAKKGALSAPSKNLETSAQQGLFDHPLPPAKPEAPPSILDALDSYQKAAAEHGEGPLLIVAGPGTGKTRTLTHRLAYLIAETGVPPHQCLAITFTRRAAGELEERLTALLPSTGGDIEVTTFHGLGLSILRQHRLELGLLEGFRVADEKACLEIARQALQMPPRGISTLLEKLGRIRRDREVASDEAGVQGEPEELQIHEQIRRYEEALRTSGNVDFDDLLILPLRLFHDHPEILEAYRQRFRWICVDEYQDIDALQSRLLRYLAPPGANLCAIGDPDQSIYRFRGADVGCFLRFQQDYESAKVVQLGHNYRSSSTIVEAATQAIHPDTLVPDRHLESRRSLSPLPIVVHPAASERGEAEFVVHTLERLLGGTSYFSLDSGRVDSTDGEDFSFADFAVLYRTRSQATALVEAFDRSGIPFQARSHDRLRGRPAVQAILEELDRVAEPNPGNPGDPTGLEEHLEIAVNRAVGAWATLASGRKEELASAYDQLRQVAMACEGDRERFLAQIALGVEVDTWDPRAERVTLMTLHAAKGLEFPVVFLTGCEDGILPLSFPGDDDPESLAEERRLFFVGMTRAESRLYLTHARRRFWRGEVREQRPSPFLSSIDDGLLKRSDTPTKTDSGDDGKQKQMSLSAVLPKPGRGESRP